MALITHLTNRKGVTLIEVVVGTAILALLAEFTAVNFIRQMPTRRLNGATQQVVWEMRAARMQAIKQNLNMIVAFTSEREYAIGADVNNNGALDGGEGTTTDIQTTYQHITFTDPLPAPVIFSPNGLANTSPVVGITNSTDSKSITVTLVGNVETD